MSLGPESCATLDWHSFTQPQGFWGKITGNFFIHVSWRLQAVLRLTNENALILYEISQPPTSICLVFFWSHLLPLLSCHTSSQRFEVKRHVGSVSCLFTRSYSMEFMWVAMVFANGCHTEEAIDMSLWIYVSPKRPLYHYVLRTCLPQGIWIRFRFETDSLALTSHGALHSPMWLDTLPQMLFSVAQTPRSLSTPSLCILFSLPSITTISGALPSSNLIFKHFYCSCDSFIRASALLKGP